MPPPRGLQWPGVIAAITSQELHPYFSSLRCPDPVMRPNLAAVVRQAEAHLLQGAVVKYMGGTPCSSASSRRQSRRASHSATSISAGSADLVCSRPSSPGAGPAAAGSAHRPQQRATFFLQAQCAESLQVDTEQPLATSWRKPSATGCYPCCRCRKWATGDGRTGRFCRRRRRATPRSGD